MNAEELCDAARPYAEFIDGLAKNVPVYCNGWRKNGRPCGHKVAVVPVSEWDQAMASSVEIECASCRKVAPIRDFIA